MKLKAFTMKLLPGNEQEYKRRHDEIWPELKALLAEKRISDYSIFLDEETLTLFAVQKVKKDSGAQDLSGEPVMRKWWAYMKDLMETNPDDSPVVRDLNLVFHME